MLLESGVIGVVEIVDGDTAGAYAWLAVGRFSLPALNPGGPSSIQQAARLIAQLRLATLDAELRTLLQNAQASLSNRLYAADALIQLHPDSRQRVILLAAQTTPIAERKQQALTALASDNADQMREQLGLVMQSASGSAQSLLAQTLLEDAQGGESLLQLVAEGKASPLLLTRPDFVEQLTALELPNLNNRLAELTRDLPPANEQLAKLIQHRKSVVDALPMVDVEAGAATFKKHCAACHQYRGAGNKIGPQLDGVGQRGLDRLLEDILDPHRNVDAAFRSTALALQNGQVLTGLKRREEGATLVLADPQGKEFTVPLADIDEQRTTPLSLMPANLGEVIPEQDFAQLVKYLLTVPKP